MTDVRRYEFGTATEDDTLVAGLRARQLAILAVGLLLAVALLRTTSPTVGLAGAIGVNGLAAAVSFWQVGGRTPEQWLPVVLRWCRDRLRRRSTTRLSPTPLFGHAADGTAIQQPPASLEGLQLLAIPIDDQAVGSRAVGLVVDRRAGTYSCVLRCRGRSFQLADQAEKQRRLAAWGGVLAGLARASSPVSRIQWLERTVPDDGDAMGRYLAAATKVDARHPSLASYLDLVDQAGPAAPQHETLLVVSLSTARARRSIKQAGGGQAGAGKVLLREVASLRRELNTADVIVDGVLPPQGLAAALRTAYDPDSRVGLARRANAVGEEPGTDPANAWPLATQETWSTYRSGQVWHATYWVAHWPRTAVGADFLAPLLLGTTGIRTVSLTMQPVPPAHAHRQVEQAVVKQAADDELRERAGFAFTARRRRSREAVERREQELAEGHADYRLAGYVTVTAHDLEELEASCGEVEQAAQQAHLELRRLYGQQEQAFSYTLPLARGLA